MMYEQDIFFNVSKIDLIGLSKYTNNSVMAHMDMYNKINSER